MNGSDEVIVMRKKMIGTTLICLTCLGMMSMLQMAEAQVGGSRNSWFPRNNPPTLSPWLEMERVSTSELDTYNQYVRPRLEMERYLMAQHREMNLRTDQQRAIQTEVQRMQNQDYKVTGEASATGKGATYRNYLHYYPRKR